LLGGAYGPCGVRFELYCGTEVRARAERYSSQISVERGDVLACIRLHSLVFHCRALADTKGKAMTCGFAHRTSNHPAAGKAGIARLLAVGHHCCGLPEPGRSARQRTIGGVLSGILFAILVGCAPHSTTSIAANSTRIDPRLLEQTDERVPHSAEEKAKAYHQSTTYAEKYRVFQRSRVLAHGGYSAAFGPRSDSIEGVTYYFDDRDQVMRTERRFPPY
jgi:hypothetical protein